MPEINIRVQKRFYQDGLGDQISLVLGTKVNLLVVENDKLPRCIKDLKATINGKSFVNNMDFNSRITSFNNQMLARVYRI